ncbi:MAG TPA: type II toxin-antitoxin system death-on-curing family toxin [Lachnoclostridium sp.]|jgi:death-on-curing protein|uniref:type II toxin-antitoxin system death-on-curing family toxin n=1 Tax=Lacrimispora sp. TaxID=2719234 RepID=UPI000EC9FC86|nr:type II toxin-antitoxin system death-on-curing family toxin [Lacrimispora sp.]HCD42672.1 type II toxin-antitoxin system death-on-curing family toxin [Lachnoclostridium sp.]
MIILTIDEIIQIHSKLILKTGGLDGIRDKGLLESAVFSISNGFDDIEIYPTIEEKAARMAFGIVNNHAFLDGNKRIGILVMLMTLKLNKVVINYSQNELIQLGLGVASGKLGYNEILNWINGHKS